MLEFMAAVRDAGVDVPAAFGRDEQGRQATEFIPGDLALNIGPLGRPELKRVGSIVRAIHEASERFRPSAEGAWITAIQAPGSDLICHNDLAPWNLIVGERWVFIDWDAAAPSTRLWDLAYAAQAFTLSDVLRPPSKAAGDLAAFVDGYRADTRLRHELPKAMHRRAAAMRDLLSRSHDTGVEPWASMFADGHGSHWRAVTQYVGSHEQVWLRALLPVR
ncbi:phosphotransferase [Marisediminicola sp. LYQ85]|uniref:phosphotransferase n=1 Tax=Marisediminicola sp. LYQ85 TaxID=3391062 RepID=UPI003983B217